MVPKKGRNGPGGKAVAASEQTSQLNLVFETAESPKGDVGGVDVDRSTSTPYAVPESETTARQGPSAMTMEEVAAYGNLMNAFKHVASNHGAPGPDGQSIQVVREHLDELLPTLHRQLLEGSYRPGMIHRVWIPKPGGQRGLGIPAVVDRIVGQAVHQVLSPHYDPTFHGSSHGFRPERSCLTTVCWLGWSDGFMTVGSFS